MLTPEDHINLAESFLEQAAKDLVQQLYDRSKVKSALAAGHAQVAAAMGLAFRPRVVIPTAPEGQRDWSDAVAEKQRIWALDNEAKVERVESCPDCGNDSGLTAGLEGLKCSLCGWRP